MNFIRRIAPLFLLSIFSLTQLHAIFPHVHHDHDGGGIDSVSTHHHHHDGSELGDFPIDSNDHDHALGFWDQILEGHSHQNLPAEENALVDAIKRQFGSATFIIDSIIDYGTVSLDVDKKQSTTDYDYGLVHDQLYLSALSHRGPPSLV